MTDLPRDLAWSDDVVAAAGSAFRRGAPVLCDVEMVSHGIIRSRLPEQTRVVCTLNDERVQDLARQLGTTRSAAAVDLWQDRLEGAIVAVGNAPTTLFHLLETVAKGGPKPAVVLGFPVGFVGAAESKEALIDNPFGIPYLAVMTSQMIGGTVGLAVSSTLFAFHKDYALVFASTSALLFFFAAVCFFLFRKAVAQSA